MRTRTEGPANSRPVLSLAALTIATGGNLYVNVGREEPHVTPYVQCTWRLRKEGHSPASGWAWNYVTAHTSPAPGPRKPERAGAVAPLGLPASFSATFLALAAASERTAAERQGAFWFARIPAS